MIMDLKIVHLSCGDIRFSSVIYVSRPIIYGRFPDSCPNSLSFLVSCSSLLLRYFSKNMIVITEYSYLSV